MGRNTCPSAASERLAEAGIEPSVGAKGDSYDNALAETINGLYKAEVIHRRGPEAPRGGGTGNAGMGRLVQSTTGGMEPLGYIPPAEFEANYHRQRAGQAATV